MIKVLHKALNVLETVSRNPEGEPLSVIAAAIGEKTTTTSNIIRVLAARNYLEKENGRWKLGFAAFLLTGSLGKYDGFCRRAEPFLRNLARSTEASAVLSAWREGERYVLLRIADGSPVTVNREYPEARNVYETATGIVLLAEQGEEAILAHIRKNGVPGNSEPNGEEISNFLRVLDTCRKKGYYVRDLKSVFEAAAPVRAADGSVRTAVGIFLPLFRVGNRKTLVQALLETTDLLERVPDCE